MSNHFAPLTLLTYALYLTTTLGMILVFALFYTPLVADLLGWAHQLPNTFISDVFPATIVTIKMLLPSYLYYELEKRTTSSEKQLTKYALLSVGIIYILYIILFSVGGVRDN